jgi:hypothetical protein
MQTKRGVRDTSQTLVHLPVLGANDTDGLGIYVVRDERRWGQEPKYSGLAGLDVDGAVEIGDIATITLQDDRAGKILLFAHLITHPVISYRRGHLDGDVGALGGPVLEPHRPARNVHYILANLREGSPLRPAVFSAASHSGFLSPATNAGVCSAFGRAVLNAPASYGPANSYWLYYKLVLIFCQ